MKSKFLGIFGKGATQEEDARTRREKLSLRIKKHMRFPESMTKHAVDCLSGSIFENFLFAQENNDMDFVGCNYDSGKQEFEENQNKFYKIDVDKKIKDYVLLFHEAVGKFGEEDFETVMQLTLYLIKEVARSNVLIQFVLNEVGQMQDLKDL
jgi:hypothetical protein